MKIEQIIKVIEQKYPKVNGWKDDFLGLQIEGKKEIKNVLLTLDFTNDFLQEIKDYKIDLIISHHPLFFGSKEDLIKKDSILKQKHQLLLQQKTNFYVIHTNIDFNLGSIPYYQAKILDCKNLKLIDNKQAISCELENEIAFNDFVKIVRNKLNLLHDPFKTNLFNKKEMIKKIIIASGAAGDLIERVNKKDALYIIGEMKHHHWLYGSDHDLKILEIGHQSEKIFVDIIEDFLLKNFAKDLSIFKIYENKYKNC